MNAALPHELAYVLKGAHRCGKCRADKAWRPGRGGRFAVCEGCKTRFPCAGSCEHLDCELVRKELKQ
jgi:hypothetical protein